MLYIDAMPKPFIKCTISNQRHMDVEDGPQLSSSSASSSSSQDQLTEFSQIKPYIDHDNIPLPSHKKRAGRKVFKETRHPVYRGVRQKNGEKWVCEVREPTKKSRIWLGTFPDPETAAIAHDVAALALRGDNAPLNFPESAGRLPRAVSTSHQDIQRAALLAARDFHYFIRPTTCTTFARGEKKNEVMKQTLHVVKASSVRMNKPKVSGQTSNVSRPSSNQVELPCKDQRLMVDVDCGNDAVGFLDEEAMFNVPGFLDSMAEGMLITPPAMKKGFSWSHEVGHSDVDLTLWGD